MSDLLASFVVTRSADFTLQLDLTIPAGRTVALLGPNGSGKSTAVAALAGLVPVSSGRITLGDVTLDAVDQGIHIPGEERRIGVVFQDYLLFPHLSTLENVAFGLRSRGAPRAAARNKAAEWLEQVGLSDMADRLPRDLSGGQAQRVALARALATSPELLLLDEPLAALDVTTRNELRRLLDDHLGRFAGPRLLITHDPAEAFLLADEVHIIENGRVTQRGSAEEIRLRPATRYAADLAGANLLSGIAAGGRVTVDDHQIRIADAEIEGPVLATIHPTAIAVYTDPPAGSPRNTWSTTVERIEHLGSRVRLLVGDPLPLTIEVTQSAHDDLGLDQGVDVWIAFKATEVGVQPSS